MFSFLFLYQLYISRDLWFFLQSLLFGKNAHRESVGGTNGRTGGRVALKNESLRDRVATYGGQDLYSLPSPSHGVQMWLVKWPMPLFKLEIWKMLRNPFIMPVHKLLSGYWRYSHYWKHRPDYRFTNPVLNNCNGDSGLLSAYICQMLFRLRCIYVYEETGSMIVISSQWVDCNSTVRRVLIRELDLSQCYNRKLCLMSQWVFASQKNYFLIEIIYFFLIFLLNIIFVILCI